MSKHKRMVLSVSLKLAALVALAEALGAPRKWK